MKVGDKVRLVHSPEEGIIIKVNGNIADVEIEDGFIIPVLLNELVIVAKEEKNFFKRDDEAMPESKSQRPRLQDTLGDICLAFAPFPHDDKSLQVYLINRTSNTVLYTYFEKSSGETKAVTNGILDSGRHVLISDYSFAKAEHWTDQIFQFLKYNRRLAPMEPVQVTYKFKAAAFFNKKVEIPELSKEGYVFELTSRERKVKAENIAQSMTEVNDVPPSGKSQAKISKKSVNAEVDLHIDKLTDTPDQMNNQQKLELQVKTFQQSLDEAIMSGNDSLKAIHGIGNGVLRDKIHKNLSTMENIWFEDTDKEKFGYGATLIHIK